MSLPQNEPSAPLELLGAGLSRRFVTKVGLVTAATYPLWHLVAPGSARDPWAAWWAVAACFALTGFAATRPRLPDAAVRALYYGCSWLVTTQLMVLAHVNAMHPFYAVGSVMAIVTTTVGFRSRQALLAYGAYVLALGLGLFAAAPDPLKIAFWIGLVPVVLIGAYRVSVHQGAAETVGAQQEELERRVRERTAELERANEQLRREIEERALLEDQLRLSQKMQAVGRLASGIAHDFNNLLTVVALYAGLARNLTDDERVRHDLDQIERAGERAQGLTARLLSFARGNVSQPVVLDPNAVVRDYRNVVRSLAGEDVEVELALAGDLRAVRMDRSHLEQVLLNLVLNARDAMPEGGKLAIATENRLAGEAAEDGAPGERVRLTVTDTGHGMGDETRSRAFEPFYTTKAPERGTGLGLAMVYRMVEQAGGAVRLHSEPGVGTQVEILLPALGAGARPSTGLSGAAGAAGALAAAPRGRGERVLVVDDDDEVRRVTCRILRAAGYRVYEANGGEPAARTLEAALAHGAVDAEKGGGSDAHDGAIDLVLTDVVMPGLSGFDLAERLAERRPELPILFMSGHTNHPSLERSRRERELPAEADLLAKPFTPGELLERVAGALQGRARPGQPGVR